MPDVSDHYNPTGAGQRRSSGVLMVVVAAMSWSTAGIWVKLILQHSQVTTTMLAFWRDIITFIFLLVGVGILAPQALKVRRSDLAWLGFMGAIGIGLFHVLWNVSVMVNGAAMATVLQYNAPIIVSISAWILWRESLNPRKIIAILLAISGTLLVALPAAGDAVHVTPQGVVIGVASALAISCFSLLAKKLSGRYAPWTVTVYAFGFASLALLPLAVWGDRGGAWQSQALWAFAGLVCIPTLGGFSLYTNSLRLLPVSVAAIIAILEVPFAAVNAYFFLGERLNQWQILGAVLVTLGVVFVSWRPRRPRSVVVPPG